MATPLEILISCSTELRKTIMEGFTIPFVIRNGFICFQAFPGIRYWGYQAQKEVRPCAVLQADVIRLTLPFGIKGYAIVPWKQDNK